ncbi:hypothetical protein BDZ94DRAFT_1347640 [Collybia nuda]|uniref:Uncharacterized protein n=1 Tax=Collybia nuda TaxID=64659 RepID=A0A9P5XVW1_9AGAR|nr:hypothetical protein BDZ94DRAFT_1347640 [Collybia nuda]
MGPCGLYEYSTVMWQSGREGTARGVEIKVEGWRVPWVYDRRGGGSACGAMDVDEQGWVWASEGCVHMEGMCEVGVGMQGWVWAWAQSICVRAGMGMDVWVWAPEGHALRACGGAVLGQKWVVEGGSSQGHLVEHCKGGAWQEDILHKFNPLVLMDSQ